VGGRDIAPSPGNPLLALLSQSQHTYCTTTTACFGEQIQPGFLCRGCKPPLQRTLQRRVSGQSKRTAAADQTSWVVEVLCKAGDSSVVSSEVRRTWASPCGVPGENLIYPTAAAWLWKKGLRGVFPSFGC